MKENLPLKKDKKTNWPVIAWFALASLVVSVALSSYFHIGTVFWVIVIAFLYCVLPTLVAAIVLGIIQLFSKQGAWLSKSLLACKIIVVVWIIQFAGLLLPTWSYGVGAAKSFCVDQLVPRIEEIKKKSGSYPEKIDDILSRQKNIPRLIRNQGALQYRHENGEYELSFSMPGIMFRHYFTYNSKTKQWTELD